MKSHTPYPIPKALTLLLIFLLLSCSDSEKTFGEDSRQISLDLPYGIGYESRISQGSFDLYLYEKLFIERGNYLIQTSISNLDCCISNYFWIIDGDTTSLEKNGWKDLGWKKFGWGSHFVKLVIVDVFGDVLSDSISIRIDEPLGVILLSPIQEYVFSNLSEADSVEFLYRVNGVDTWEQAKSYVYFSADPYSLWEEKNILENGILKQPLIEPIYYWGVKAFTEQDTAYSEMRWILKD